MNGGTTQQSGTDLGQPNTPVDERRWSTELRLRATSCWNNLCNSIRGRWSINFCRRPSKATTSRRIRGTSALINTMLRRRAISARSRKRCKRSICRRSRRQSQPVHESVHSGRDQRHFAGDGHIAGTRCPRRTRLATRRMRRTHSAARGRIQQGLAQDCFLRDEHRLDAGEPQRRQFPLKRRRPRRPTSRATVYGQTQNQNEAQAKINSRIQYVAGADQHRRQHEQVERR